MPNWGRGALGECGLGSERGGSSAEGRPDASAQIERPGAGSSDREETQEKMASRNCPLHARETEREY